MGHEFEARDEVEPGEGGTVRTAFGGYTPESTVTAWEPLRRFAYRSGTAEDGVRSSDALYRFLRRFRGPLVVCQAVFSEVDQQRTERAWQSWLDELFA